MREVLYQTRSHASRTFSLNYPPQHQQVAALAHLLSEFGQNFMMFLELWMLLFGWIKLFYRCSFDVLTSDGSLHEVEISQDPSASVFSARTSNNNSTLKEFPENVFCLNYHPETSLLAIVGGAVSAPVTSSGNTGKLLPKSVSISVQSLGCHQYQCWGPEFYVYELDVDY
ncbi:MAG2-interacting protein 2 [Camellia lanceoleosa]|uniref:MAG2-interacting protein 2 n=1 Tax=Camellia lanceoleosa TaxID=1840588 RepID=A0ACC0GZ20_9ERIC|nr:MAG2-interacting protein 2 [Camellia lanceoleosa]